MKKLLFIFAALLLAGVANAQSNKEEIDLIQSVFGMEKKALVADFMSLDGSKGDAFWTLYDEYETKRKELGKDRLNALSNYVENYDKLADDKYNEVVASMISLRKSNDKLIDTYYKKIKKASGSKIAAQFFQLENYFLSEIRSSVMEGIPYIGEFDKK